MMNMQRRDFVKTVSAGVGAALLGGSVEAKPRKRPNLLYVFPDQFRRESLGCWRKPEYRDALRTGTDPVVTPTLDKLAGESIVFTQAVSTCPVCSPHRGMLMSGMYPWRNGIVNNCHQTRKDGLHADITCLTDVLREAGYDTAYVGKTHWERNDPLFDEKGNYVGATTPPGGHHMNAYDTYIPPGASRHGSDYWFQCVKDVHKDPRVYSSDAARIDGKRDGEQYRPEIYSPKLEGDVLTDYIRNTHGQRDPSRPFCAIWAPNPPHNPYDSEDDCDEIAYREHYRGKQGLLNRPNAKGHETAELAEKRAPFYFANVTGVDKQLARVLEALDASGEAENTIVVFTSDHGEMMGSHGKFGKLVLYEESFCVPFLIRFPERIQHRLEDLMLSTVDIMPTLLGMMGLEDRIPAAVQGTDFSRELTSGNGSADRRPASALFLGYNNKIKGLRTDRYSFQVDEDGHQLLFDNREDPYQVHPLKLGDIPETDAEFIRAELGNWLQRSGDPWFPERKGSGVIKYPA